MALLLSVVTVVVALEHLWFLVLEMFLWQKPLGLKTFRNTPDKAKASAVLAANQGLYNGFLVAGLLWGLVHPTREFGLQLQIFFFGLVVVAGVFGGFTVSKRILVLQALPALVGLGLGLALRA